MSPLLRAQEPTHVAHGPVRTDWFSLVFARVRKVILLLLLLLLLLF